MPPRRISSCQRSQVQPKTRQVLVPRPAAHQLQVTLSANPYSSRRQSTDRSTAQDKASARVATCSTSTSKQGTRPVRLHHAAIRHASGTPHCPRQGKCSCRVQQNNDFKLRWRRISTRQLIEALPKTRLVLVLHLAAHQLQRSAPVRCEATPPQLIMPAEQSTAQGKARQVLLPAAHQLQAKLASDLHTPADRSTAQDKASARAAPRSTSTSKQSNRPVRCHHAAAFHARGTKHSSRQGKCSCCVPQHTNFKSR